MQTVSNTPNSQQQNVDWATAKLGRFSCSQYYRLMTEPKLKADKEAGNLSDGAMTYVYECIAERITGVRAKDEFTSKYTDWGINYEPVAKKIYETVWDVIVIDCGYIPHLDNQGGSPDGLVGIDGIIEIKCPFTITSHLEHKLKALTSKPEYYWQCLGYLLTTGRKWIDFISYHPSYPGKLQVFKTRLTYAECEADIQRLESKLIKANEIFNSLIKHLC